ncbi:MAG TPA: PAS and helix-turn-helix domain-containing protein [Solirubrobacteraceae bacterium]|nr:PAS and helix-turn-helix domain-containing protein [Solirubrobacteraceae bacterium]
MSLRPDGSNRGPFWSVFERSNIPMALVDRDKRYVAANDAALTLYQYGREDVIGRRAGRTVAGMPASAAEADWRTLLRHNELYGERLITHPSGRAIRVTFAAHGTTVDTQWLALFVTVSAKLEPDGVELICACPPGAGRSPGDPANLGRLGVALTPREREVVRRVALGRSTPQIAADLSLSPATVRSHVRNAMVKAGAHTRAQLVALVLGEGLADR